MAFPSFIVVLASGFAAGVFQRGIARSHRAWPTITPAMVAVLALMFAAQLASPGLLFLLGRDPALVEQGQLWRAVTALFVQDGGWPGAIFNLTCLSLLGAVAERRWGTSQWLLVYFGGGITTEFLALAWQPHGAGNSVAYFALAGALTTHHLNGRLGAIQILIRIVGFSAGAALVLSHDIHGLAYWIGAILGGVLTIQDRRRTTLRIA
jgi:rhomboid protease GluP